VAKASVATPADVDGSATSPPPADDTSDRSALDVDSDSDSDNDSDSDCDCGAGSGFGSGVEHGARAFSGSASHQRICS
jgi:hypothetical protein